MRRIALAGGVIFSAAVSWFAVDNYLSAGPIAEDNLRGLALSMTSAIDNIAVHDPSLHNLSTFQTHEIAFFAVIDRKGVYRFHSNPDLIGSPVQGELPLATLRKGITTDARLTLRTGENAFEFNAPMYLPGETVALRLTLHTYRADTVVRRARLNMTVLFGLLAGGWMLALALYRFSRREDDSRLAMARRESLAQLGEMAAMLAHEIRNPLGGIKGFAQVIEKKPDDARIGNFARRIVLETQRLEALVSDLLAYARSEREVKTAVDLGEVISHAAALLAPEADQLRITIDCQCPPGLEITGDRDGLGQILLNLGKNALQAMPEGGSLRIGAEGIGNTAIVTVEDTGQGIGPEELPRIFQPFFTTKAKGTGLGLALCKKIAEEHGGGIRVESAPGAGTSVRLTLPLRRTHHGRSRL